MRRWKWRGECEYESRVKVNEEEIGRDGRSGEVTISAKMIVTGEPLEHYKFCQNNGILTSFFRPFRVIVPHEI